MVIIDYPSELACTTGGNLGGGTELNYLACVTIGIGQVRWMF